MPRRFTVVAVVLVVSGFAWAGDDDDVNPLWAKGSDQRKIEPCGVTVKRTVDKRGFPKDIEDKYGSLLSSTFNDSGAGPAGMLGQLCSSNGDTVEWGSRDKPSFKSKFLGAVKKELTEIRYGYAKQSTPSELKKGVWYVWFSEDSGPDLAPVLTHFLEVSEENANDPERVKELPWGTPEREKELAKATAMLNSECGTHLTVSYDKASFEKADSGELRIQSGATSGCIDTVSQLARLCAKNPEHFLSDFDLKYWAKHTKKWLAPVKKIECRYVPKFDPLIGLVVIKGDTMTRYMPGIPSMVFKIDSPDCLEDAQCSEGRTCSDHVCVGPKGASCQADHFCLSHQCKGANPTHPEPAGSASRERYGTVRV